MHARHHFIGDGVRPNSVSGRVSGEGSIQGHGKYNWEHRNFNPGFGGDPPKPYPSPPKPPYKDDVFMEAGRLAAEYLVSKRLLPPNLLPGKWQRDFQEFRAQVRENPMLFSEGRNSGFARVGNVLPEGTSARRRFPDEFSYMGHRNQMRGKRRMRSYRGLGSDWGRENGRKRHCSEKTGGLPDTLEGGDDSFGAPYQEEPQVGLDVGGRASKVITPEMALKTEIVGNSKSKQETCEFPDDADSKVNSSSARRDLPTEVDIELSKGLDHADVLNSEIKEVNDSKFGDKIKGETAPQENFEKQDCLVEDEPLSKHGSDLLQFCSFAKVPTRARSSLALSLSRVGQGPGNEERNDCDIAPASRSNVPMEEDSAEASTLSLKSSTSDISRVHSVRPLDEVVDVDAPFVQERERCTSSHSFSDGSSSMHQEDSNDGPPGFVTFKSVVLLNKDPKSPREEDSVEAFTHSMKSLTSDISRVRSAPSLNEAVDSDATFVTGTERCTRSQSFSDVASSMHQEDASDGPPGFVTCKPMVIPNEGDSSAHHVGTWVAHKRPGELPSGSEVPWEEDSVLDSRRVKSQSSSDVSSSMHQEDASDGPPGFVRCKSMVLPNEGDSSMIHVGKWEAEKRPGELPSESKVTREEDSIQASIHRMMNLSSDISGVLSFRSLDEAVDLVAPFVVEPKRCKRSQSFLDGYSPIHEEDESDGPPGFVSCKSIVLPNCGNSSAHHVGAWEAGNSPGKSPTRSKVPREEESIQASIHGKNNLPSDIYRVQSIMSFGEALGWDPTFVAETERCSRLQSFSDGSSFRQQEELSDDPPGFERCNSPVLLNKANSFTHFVGTSEEIKRHRESPGESKGPMKEHSVELSAPSDMSRVQSVQSLDEVPDLDDAFVGKGERFCRSQSFSDGSSFIHQEESRDGPSEFVRCNSLVLPNKGDSFVHHVGLWETTKRPRESSFSKVSEADEDFLLHNLRAKQSCLEVERLSCGEKIVELVDKQMLEGGFVPKSGAESEIAAKEEKHLFPSMFKMGDLNLLDVSDIAQSSDDLIQDHVSSTPSTSGVEKEAARDVDLSMISNSLSDYDDYGRLVSGANEATRVNVANDFLKEKVFDTTGHKTETMYSSVEHFLNHTDNSVDLPDVQDACGSAISRLLGTDFSNCSSVSTDIDDLHSQLSLHGQGGIPVVDDPIYLSFGDIPISFLGVWDQPTQDYGKPF
ncbi:hypothetical protein CKAN_01360500 [Cinnamomum micranthum f. kanehirae]|uniref:Uncharacterized protein n=1 Tax=Cinnamomum micranthum f. kanehirae TaxID=337451 RepID=A0A3S3MYB6_9MAGN|nr:hypothetical protein CKAN_01360500 [Cinnamomum micranthum f. kanehirae]